MILTEEELRGIEVNNDTNTYEATVIDKLVNSHRLLLSANAELSFKNNKYREALNSILNGNWTMYKDKQHLEIWETDRINPYQISKEALEEVN